MKILITALLTLVMSGYANAQLRVVTSASIFADMIQNIGGGHVSVFQLVPTGADPHSYEPVPSDIQTVSRAELIFLNGLTFELWIEKLISHVNTTTPVVILTDGIEPLESADYPGAPDPHAWLDPLMGKVYLENIYKALSAADPANESYYRSNYEAYLLELSDLHLWSLGQVERIPADQRKLITSHDAFRYFGARYGFEVYAAMGTSTDADVRIADIMQLQQAIKNHGIMAVFIESTINPKLMEQVARDYNIVVGGELYADSLSDAGKPAGTYLGMLRHNMETITAGLLRDPETSSSKAETMLAGWLALISFLLVAFCFTWYKIDYEK